MSKLSRWVASTPLATPVAFSVRSASVVRHVLGEVRRSLRWLVGTREHTNYTFELTPLNIEHLAWWVAHVTDIDVATARTYIREAQEDGELRDHVLEATRRSKRWRLADSEVRLHKRLGWYALVRATRPELVVETGTDKGLGAVVLAAAVLRNGAGRVMTVDVNPNAGYLVTGRYASVVEKRLGDLSKYSQNWPSASTCSSTTAFTRRSMNSGSFVLSGPISRPTLSC